MAFYSAFSEKINEFLAANKIPDEQQAREFYGRLARAFCAGSDVLSGDQITAGGEPLDFDQAREQFDKLRKSMLLQYAHVQGQGGDMRVTYPNAPPWLMELPERADEQTIDAIRNIGIQGGLPGCGGLSTIEDLETRRRFLDGQDVAVRLAPAPVMSAYPLIGLGMIGAVGVAAYYLFFRDGKSKKRKKSRK